MDATVAAQGIHSRNHMSWVSPAPTLPPTFAGLGKSTGWPFGAAFTHASAAAGRRCQTGRFFSVDAGTTKRLGARMLRPRAIATDMG